MEFVLCDIDDDEAFMMHEVSVLSRVAYRSSRKVGRVHKIQLLYNMMMPLQHQPDIIV